MSLLDTLSKYSGIAVAAAAGWLVGRTYSNVQTTTDQVQQIAKDQKMIYQKINDIDNRVSHVDQLHTQRNQDHSAGVMR